MIRVAIYADTGSRARALSEMLAEDERIDVVDARAIHTDIGGFTAVPVDVVVAAHLSLHQLSRASTPVVAITGGPVEANLLAREVRAVLPSNAPVEEITAAITAAAVRFTVLTPTQVRQWLRPAMSNIDELAIAEALTPRELQVLRMLADGLGNKQIAAGLEISSHTAKFHVAQILAKLGASTRAEAVSIGIRRGLVPI